MLCVSLLFGPNYANRIDSSPTAPSPSSPYHPPTHTSPAYIPCQCHFNTRLSTQIPKEKAMGDAAILNTARDAIEHKLRFLSFCRAVVVILTLIYLQYPSSRQRRNNTAHS
ncbi:hypothetical protein BDR03DRAFT_944142 [Suillus americanus]|nr:hypothetical protein BDR03DRAFT_944142 [Suillus americanus]